jgi:hypothetical protein
LGYDSSATRAYASSLIMLQSVVSLSICQRADRQKGEKHEKLTLLFIVNVRLCHLRVFPSTMLATHPAVDSLLAVDGSLGGGKWHVGSVS